MILIGLPKQVPRVYTLPDCYRCDALKARLGETGRDFEEVKFDTEAHVEFIMRNMFGNPPILEIGQRIFASEDLFVGEALNDGKLKEALNDEEA